MSLYSEWKARAESLESDAAYQQYWSNYFSQETEVYKQVLLSHDKPLSGTVKALSEQVGMDPVAFVGYLDGANTSFADGEKDLDALTEILKSSSSTCTKPRPTGSSTCRSGTASCPRRSATRSPRPIGPPRSS